MILKFLIQIMKFKENNKNKKIVKARSFVDYKKLLFPAISDYYSYA